MKPNGTKYLYNLQKKNNHYIHYTSFLPSFRFSLISLLLFTRIKPKTASSAFDLYSFHKKWMGQLNNRETDLVFFSVHSSLVSPPC